MLLIQLIFSEDKGNVINKNRFLDDYTGNELILPKKNPKPEDYEQIFQGNTNDDFKIGITVTKKSLKVSVIGAHCTFPRFPLPGFSLFGSEIIFYPITFPELNHHLQVSNLL